MAAKKPVLSASARKAREKFLLEITSLPTAAGREDRVIERIGDVEFAGGIVGDEKKSRTVAEVEADAVKSEREKAGV